MVIYLTGYMCSGKTTLGSLLKEMAGVKFTDLDQYIEEKEGLSVNKIFAQKGETAFRDGESEIIANLCSKLGVVVATGGGAIIREENRLRLKANSTVIFIDRDLDLLSTEGRPLSQSEGVKALYEKRLPIYKEVADVTVESGKDTTPEETVQSILDILNG